MSKNLRARVFNMALFASASFLLLTPGIAPARVLEIEIERREPLLSGQPFGPADAERGGAYELIEGHVLFGFDPKNPANARVTDLALAPAGESGLVEARGDFLVLQPIDPTKRSGTALVDVPNRGRRLVLSGMNRVQKAFGSSALLDPNAPSDWGDGFLMRQGLTVIWVGWQADVPNFPGSMGLEVPRAISPDGSPLTGRARSDWVVDEPVSRLELAALGHTPHRAKNVGRTKINGDASPVDVLTRRQGREAKRETVPPSAWAFAPEGEAIVATGAAGATFEAGWIYEFVYTSENPPLVGLGFAAYRDFASFAKFDSRAPFPVKRTIAHGLSQSGRFLRHFLFEGFSEDESGRAVFDGVMIQIAGAGRGGFNHRFSHPGRVGNPYANFFYPGDQFPFTSRPSRDGEKVAGLLDRAVEKGTAPKIFQINTGYEYWGRGASLIHMTPDGQRDVAPLENERLFHIASAPHYSPPFPPNEKAEVIPGLFVGSSVDLSGFRRALLRHLLAWVEEDVAPPQSVIPTIESGSLVPPESLRFPLAITTPRSPHVADRLDFGPRWETGIIDEQPPKRFAPYPIRVPALDALGSDAGGLRGLELRVPIGTYTPWALRFGKPGGANEMAGYLGSFLPLARTDEERRDGDQRKSLEALYPTREAYDERLAKEIDQLVASGWLLPEDRAHAWQGGSARWNWITDRAKP